MLVVDYEDQGRVVYDLASGQPLWSTHPDLGFNVYSTNITVPKSPLPLIHNDFEALNVKALDLVNGTTVWNYSGACGQVLTQDKVILTNYASVQAYQSTPFGASPKEHSIVCLDRETGQKLWTAKPQYLIFNPTVYGDTFLFASYDGCFYALDLNNGETKWKTQIADLSFNSQNSTGASLSMCLTTSPYIDPESNSLYWIVASHRNGNSESCRTYSLYSLSLSDGAPNLTPQLEPLYVSVTGGKTNTVLLNSHFFVKEDTTLLCLDSSSGAVLWRRNGVQQDTNPFLVGDKVIAVFGNCAVAYR
jgi:outer membrane protein assembly factor BamB